MVAMEGRVRAANNEFERAISIAWHNANFARAKNLPDLNVILRKLRPAKAQTADEVAGVFLALQAKGRSVKIRERSKSKPNNNPVKRPG